MLDRDERLRPKQLADRLHTTAIHLLRHLRRTDSEIGISAAQLSVLSVLMHGPLTLGELATAEQVQPPTMSRMVRDMEAADLVSRERDAEDRRVIWVRSTHKGDELLRLGRLKRLTTLERQLDQLSRGERIHLDAALDTLAALLDRFVPTR